MKRIYEYNDIQPILERLLQDKESSEVEFKSAKGGFPSNFWSYLFCFCQYAWRDYHSWRKGT